METVFFKSIEEALPVLRPGDKLDQVISNKFAYVSPICTNGKFDDSRIMYLHNNKIYLFMKSTSFKTVLQLPNIQHSLWCFDHKENGKPFHYVTKTDDNRYTKRLIRRCIREILKKHPDHLLKELL